MAFIPTPDCAQAVLVYGDTTNSWTNTLWFNKPNYTELDLQALAEYLHNWSAANIMPQLSSTFSIQTVKVYGQNSVNDYLKYSGLTPVGGSQPANASPLNAALVVTFYTLLRGRSGRGRNYVTGFAEDDVSPTSVNDAVIVSNIQQAYITLKTGVQTGPGWFWGVVSHYLNGAPRAQGDYNDVDNIVVRTALLGSQRRRIDREA